MRDQPVHLIRRARWPKPFVLSFAAFLLASADPVRSQPDLLSPRTPVRVTTLDHRTTGIFLRSMSDTLLVRSSESSLARRIALSDVTGFEVGHRKTHRVTSALKGGGWGALVGGIVGGLLFGIGCSGADLLCEEEWHKNALGGAFLFAVPGAVIGVGIGAAAPATETSWTPIEPTTIRVSDCLRDAWDQCTGRYETVIGREDESR